MVFRKLSRPITGMMIGILAGVVFGVGGVIYFDITDRLDQLCFVSGSLLLLQLFGGTIAAALGKPHNGKQLEVNSLV